MQSNPTLVKVDENSKEDLFLSKFVDVSDSQKTINTQIVKNKCDFIQQKYKSQIFNITPLSDWIKSGESSILMLKVFVSFLLYVILLIGNLELSLGLQESMLGFFIGAIFLISSVYNYFLWGKTDILKQFDIDINRVNVKEKVKILSMLSIFLNNDYVTMTYSEDEKMKILKSVNNAINFGEKKELKSLLNEVFCKNMDIINEDINEPNEEVNGEVESIPKNKIMLWKELTAVDFNKAQKEILLSVNGSLSANYPDDIFVNNSDVEFLNSKVPVEDANNFVKNLLNDRELCKSSFIDVLKGKKNTKVSLFDKYLRKTYSYSKENVINSLIIYSLIANSSYGKKENFIDKEVDFGYLLEYYFNCGKYKNPHLRISSLLKMAQYWIEKELKGVGFKNKNPRLQEIPNDSEIDEVFSTITKNGLFESKT